MLMFVPQGREGWWEVTQADKCPLPAVSRHGVPPVTGREPDPWQRMRPAFGRSLQKRLCVGNPLRYSCMENPMDRGAWQATVHGVTKIWT